VSDEPVDLTPKLTEAQAKDKLWRLGNLEWKLRGVQQEMRRAVYDSKGKKTVFLCARRLGKTFVMMLLAVEQCIKQKDSIVKVLFPKKKDAKDVARFQMREILKDCPVDLKPEWKEADKMFVFPNGSEIQMAGTDAGNAESIRGSACHLAILDESGFHDYNDFTYIVQSIVMPTLLTTKGKMILASTPSKEPDHPFMIDYVTPARKDGSLIEYNIYSNPMITEEDIEEMAEEFPGGVEDPDFQREYMLKSDVISSEFVVPEFDQKLKEDILITVGEKPAFYDAYTSGDPAATDLTVVLFAYYDFLKSQIIVCDELVLGGEGEVITTLDIADGIRRKEKLNFSNPLTGEAYKPYLRVMDNNNKILINDLNVEHGLEFVPTAKDNKEAQINKLRMMLKQGRLMIDKKCKTLIYHLEVARWAKNKKDFQRLKGDRSRGMKPHHCDAVDALVYLVRNVYMEKNPYPDDFFELKGEGVHLPQSFHSKDTKAAEIMYGIIRKKKPNNN
jgi:PBSX family phage terminase large subunit